MKAKLLNKMAFTLIILLQFAYSPAFANCADVINTGAIEKLLSEADELPFWVKFDLENPKNSEGFLSFFSDENLRLSQQEPRFFESFVLYKGRIFFSNYFQRTVYSNMAFKIVNFKPAHVVGREMPYLEFVNGSLVYHPSGGSRTLLSLLPPKMTLYRGTSKDEGDIRSILKSLASSPKTVQQTQIDQLDNVLGIESGGDYADIPLELKSKWDELRGSAIAGKISAKTVADKLGGAMAGMHSGTFTTTDLKTARHFAERIDKQPCVEEFQVDLSEIPDTILDGLYAGYENTYTEIAFSTKKAQILLQSGFVADDCHQ